MGGEELVTRLVVVEEEEVEGEREEGEREGERVGVAVEDQEVVCSSKWPPLLIDASELAIPSHRYMYWQS